MVANVIAAPLVTNVQPLILMHLMLALFLRVNALLVPNVLSVLFGRMTVKVAVFMMRGMEAAAGHVQQAIVVQAIT